MKIAIPVKDDVIFDHFGGAESFYFAEVETGSSAILKEATVAAPEHVPGAFPTFLRENNVTVVIAQGMGAHAKDMLEASSIITITGAPTQAVRQLVESYLSGDLKSHDVECTHHHHGDSHC